MAYSSFLIVSAICSFHLFFSIGTIILSYCYEQRKTHTSLKNRIGHPEISSMFRYSIHCLALLRGEFGNWKAFCVWACIDISAPLLGCNLEPTLLHLSKVNCFSHLIYTSSKHLVFLIRKCTNSANKNSTLSSRGARHQSRGAKDTIPSFVVLIFAEW